MRVWANTRRVGHLKILDLKFCAPSGSYIGYLAALKLQRNFSRLSSRRESQAGNLPRFFTPHIRRDILPPEMPPNLKIEALKLRV